MPGRHQRKMFASPIGTATPNTVYAQQSASPIGAGTPNTIYTRQPACQEAINAKFSHLLLAQLFRAQFTPNRAPNPHARKPSTQNVRISKYCACHANKRRGPRRPGTPQPFLEAPSTAPGTQTGTAAHGDQARQNPFWRLQVVRLPRTATRRAATLSGGSKYCTCDTNRNRGPRRPEPFLEAPSTAPSTQTEAAARATTLPGGSKYCACHADRSRGPRRPGAPQPLLEAPSTAPAAQTGAAAHGDQARRNPF